MGSIETHLDIALRYSDGDLPRTSVFPPVRYRVVVAERFLRPRQFMACAQASHCSRSCNALRPPASNHCANRSSSADPRRNGFNDRPRCLSALPDHYRAPCRALCGLRFRFTPASNPYRPPARRRAPGSIAVQHPSVLPSCRITPRLDTLRAFPWSRAQNTGIGASSACLADETCPGAGARPDRAWGRTADDADGEAGLGRGWGGACVICCGYNGTSPTYTRTSIFLDSIRLRGHLAPSSPSPNQRFLSSPTNMRVALREYERPYFRPHLPPASRLFHSIAWYARADTKPLPILDSLPPWYARVGRYLLDPAPLFAGPPTLCVKPPNQRFAARARLHRHAPTPPCFMPPLLVNASPCRVVGVRVGAWG
ncbi:hypothetical protein DFH08DRAFT_280683 [Mycena albidolilacea]|uniref:Uncharacterized protein n=1 Tax=Mycena albidolilacea TaxID=1033008 RepID=A0AAD6ZS15_9AGAR|nr:hypothetical protein DFH08DRAFT_280683 [Mycena albidolilacea]